ncbi:hypothetical protein PCANC_06215 [Puccinia coronata f. sp. avenae]|uniref:Uncharacterized protein n=1 Tax=Puccinia coronata f. sp. avenae TaxID=200324 RepID=A0A2N5SJE2_9BASI|nr:hypothetical protein PCANC_17973 [Puccinia coronata f. sp. avenae]PLW44443.1 hypothetical protein PCANC_06215 [Puccinia coronata f. sp. avenae]
MERKTIRISRFKRFNKTDQKSNRESVTHIDYGGPWPMGQRLLSWQNTAGTPCASSLPRAASFSDRAINLTTLVDRAKLPSPSQVCQTQFITLRS